MKKRPARQENSTTASSLAPLRARAPEFMPTSEFTRTPAVALTRIPASLNPVAAPFVPAKQPLSPNSTIVSSHTPLKARLHPTTSSSRSNNPDSPNRAIVSRQLSAAQSLKNAQMFYDHECYKDAVSSCSAAIIKQPRNPEAYCLRASAYRELDNCKQALQDLLTAEKQGSKRAKTALGLLFQKTAQDYIAAQNYEKGIDYWIRAESRGIIGLAKDVTDLYLEMVKGYITAGKYEIAASHLTDLKALGDDNFKKEVAAIQKELQPALKLLVDGLSVVSPTKTNSSPNGCQPGKMSFRDALMCGRKPTSPLASSSMPVETNGAEVRGSHIVPKGKVAQIERAV